MQHGAVMRKLGRFVSFPLWVLTLSCNPKTGATRVPQRRARQWGVIDA
jgi:hypothetical protein